MRENKGIVVQAVGPVIDVRFKDEHLPELLTALKVALPNGKELTLEVSQHIGDDIVRAVSMGATDGLVRGMKVLNTLGIDCTLFHMNEGHSSFVVFEVIKKMMEKENVS